MDITQLDPHRRSVADLSPEGASPGRDTIAPGEVGYFGLIWRRLRRDRTAMLGGMLVALISLAALFAPVLAPHDPAEQFRDGLTPDGQPVPSTLLTDGSARFPIGTDANGRDLLSRILYGAQVSLIVGVLANTLAVTLGTLIGSVAGFFGDPLETLLMRFTDVMMAFPTLLLAMALVAILKPNLWIIILVIGVVYWTWIARVVYGQVLALRERDFVTATRALGAGRLFILVRHILPQLVPTIIVWGTLGIATNVMLEASLSYLGIGVQPPTPSWGGMIQQGQSYYRTAPWMVIFPGLAIMLTVFAFNLLGDGLRDALDPTQRGNL
ncbi:MAG: Peptide transporter permease [Anaerolineales bacterium]|jgi:peptide/nickel transport system permease protein|nr:Peptide transporter permease [Anaerolineales bacterium]